MKKTTVYIKICADCPHMEESSFGCKCGKLKVKVMPLYTPLTNCPLEDE